MDGRKNNGGHSTKAKRQDDKRLLTKIERLGLTNLMDEALTNEDWVNIFKTSKVEAIAGDINHMKFLAEYYFGKPQQNIDHTTQGDKINVPVINVHSEH